MYKTIFLLIIFLLSTQVSLASTVVRTGEVLNLSAEQSVAGGFYAVAGRFDLASQMHDDVYVVAANSDFSGGIKGDLGVLAGEVVINSNVEGDIRVVSSAVKISGAVNGSLVVIAHKLEILPGATIGGDILFYGDIANINGDVAGDILGSYRNLDINSKIGGKVDVAATFLSFGSQADVTGMIKYVSPYELTKTDESKLAGVIEYNSIAGSSSILSAAKSWSIVFMVSFFSTLSFFIMFRRIFDNLVSDFGTASYKKALLGLLLFLFLPMVAFLLFSTVIGLALGLVILCVWFLAFALAIVLLPVYLLQLGMLLSGLNYQLSVPYLMLAVVLTSLILMVPIIGWLVIFWSLIVVLGDIYLKIYHFIA